MHHYRLGETISEGMRHRVVRAHRTADGLAVVLKLQTQEGAEERARLQREERQLQQSASPGVIKVHELFVEKERAVLVLEEMGGVSLDRLPVPLSLVPFLQLAAGLAETVATLHERGIVHKNLCPANILLNPTTGEFRLIDFAIADRLPRYTVATQPSSSHLGSLTCISPEQTGRINRAVDYRTDLYSLGVTFYWLLTGTYPFEAEDDLGMVHAHIAVTPPPPHERNPALPEMLSRVVLKLMAKMAEDRYQNGRGLKPDLHRCLQALQESGTVPLFELARDDFNDRLHLPNHLYGREEELKWLLAAFERTRSGHKELLLVAGYSGTGKTALVREIRPAIEERRGYFIEGKFEQLQRDIPYFAWIEAVSEYVNYLLMEGDAHLGRRKAIIGAAVGNIGRVLIEVIPKLELILGEQPEVPPLAAAEAQNRFNYVFLEFIKAIATEEHPIVIFLDDLQWIDAASLGLLKMVLSNSAITHLLVIGAYRDNEVDQLHPLSIGLDLLRKEHARIDSLPLRDLSETMANELIADTVQSSPEHTRPLTQLIYAKTGGNPFFLLETLKALAEQQALAFDCRSKRWQWDIDALQRVEITDNIVTLMLGKIRRLPAQTQNLLPLAACLGFRFNAASLSIIAEQSESTVLEELLPAVQEGVVTALNSHYQFSHDRVQQAAYALIPAADIQRFHLAAGMLLLQHIAETGQREQLFAVVDHLNIGAELIAGEEAKIELAQMNLRAGQKARASAAFSSAAKYFLAGVALLDEKSWAAHYHLTLETYNGAAEAAALIGEFNRANALFSQIVQHARDPVDMIPAYISKMMALSSQGRLQEHIKCALEIIERLGIHIPSHPTIEQIAEELNKLRTRFEHESIPALAKLPLCADQRTVETMRVLNFVQDSTYSGRPDLFAMFAVESAKSALRDGLTPDSMHAFSHLGLLLLGLPGGDIDQGYQFGSLARALAKRDPGSLISRKVLAITSGMVLPYKQHLRETLDQLQPLYPLLKESGDFELAGYVACWYGSNSLLCGLPLSALEKEIGAYLEDMRQIHSEVGCRWLAPFRQAALNLQGQSSTPWILDGEAYRLQEMLPLLVETGNLAAQTALHVNTLVLCYLFGRYDEALVASDAAGECKAGMVAMPIEPVWFFYDSLTRLALLPEATETQQKEYLARVDANLAYLKVRAHHAPMNYLHKQLLVEAELDRIHGRVDALEKFERAIELAQEHRFVHEKALADELAGKFWWGRGNTDFARIHLQKAVNGYMQWQAFAKVKALESTFPQLRDSANVAASSMGRLDLETIMKATRAISREFQMDHLLTQVMHIVLENAGAQTGLILMEHEGSWVAAAQGSVDRTEVLRSPQASTDENGNGPFSLSVVRFVARTRDTVVLEDAFNKGDFVRDPYIRRAKTKSLLCAPLMSRGKVIGILYLENNLTTHAFTHERRTVLEMLASQAAISLEIAKVYEALRESEAKHRRIIDTAAEGIVVLNSESNITFTNHHFSELLGYTPEELLGKNLSFFIFKEDMADHQAHMALRKQGATETYERKIRHKDGHAVWTIISATSIVTDGVYTGSFAMITDITERRRAEQELRRSNRFLRTLSRCNETLIHATEERKLLRDMCRVVIDSGNFTFAWVGYLEGRELRVMAAVDAHNTDPMAEGALVDTDLLAHNGSLSIRAALSGEIQVVPDAANHSAPWRDHAREQGYGSAVSLPLRASGRLIGALSIAATERNAFGPEEVTLLSELAGDLGFGIEGLRMRRDRERFVEQLRASMESTIRALSDTVELRDPYTAGHQRRVAELAAAVARSMGWSEERVQLLFHAGMVHDIGKIAIPAEILSKPGRLSSAEDSLVHAHAEAGFDLLKAVEFPWPIAQIVYQHHERLDGSGYPLGLKDGAICSEARVLAVCDVVEAMSTHRPYRPGLGIEVAIAHIEEGKGKYFDPDVVEHCARVIRKDGFKFQ